MVETLTPGSQSPSVLLSPAATPKLQSLSQTSNLQPSSRAASMRTNPGIPAIVRTPLPIKLISPKISKPAASQLHSGPSSATKATPSSPKVGERPASPPKIRAKITQGISPKRKQLNRSASPQRPNIVKTGRALESSLPMNQADRAGLGISADALVSSAFSAEDDSETSIADASFVFNASGASESDLIPSQTVWATPSLVSQKDAVTVHLRLRPLPAAEPSAWIVSPLTSAISLQPALSANRFAGGGSHYFDAVHTGSSNDALYKTLARPLVHSVLSGFNALIFAYGQTASGKTFTLSGDEKSGAEGITQKAVKDLFLGIKGSKKEREWLVRCSWLEVYNEGVKDLLESGNVPQVRSSQATGTFVAPLAEVIVTSPLAVFALLERGQQYRHVNSTDWNERSSRSHTAFKIVVESWARGCEGRSEGAKAKGGADGRKVRISELVLVDLAGSEKYGKKGGKERRAEGANINKSLLTLGKVIYALSERDLSGNQANSPPHIPYRDSKLTRILQNSLSGNSKIAVVATMNQSVTSLEESLSTINFVKRIKNVQLAAKLNEVDAPECSVETEALLVRYRSEADALRRLVLDLQERQQEQERALDAAAETAGQGVVEDRIEELEDRLREIGRLVVHGEGLEGDDSDVDVVWDSSCSPAKEKTDVPSVSSTGSLGQNPVCLDRPQMPSLKSGIPSHLDFTVSAATLRQQLHAAHLQILSLQSKLSSRPSLSALDLSSRQKDELIARLQGQLGEAEIALEASTLQPLPKIREDVEAEYAGKVRRLEKELREAKEFSDACQRKCEKLERLNARLIGLAHRETAELVGRLKEEASPTKEGLGIRAGDAAASGAATPAMRRLRGMASITGMRPRPMSVLADMSMGGDHNRLGCRFDTEDDGDELRSPLTTSKAGTTYGGTAKVMTPTTLGRSIRTRVQNADACAANLSSAAALTRRETLVMSLKNLAGSEDENGDESALVDL